MQTRLLFLIDFIVLKKFKRYPLHSHTRKILNEEKTYFL